MKTGKDGDCDAQPGKSDSEDPKNITFLCTNKNDAVTKRGRDGTPLLPAAHYSQRIQQKTS